MASVHETIEIDASADEVWAVAGDPGRIADWLPLLSSSHADAGQRECTMTNGGQLKERILEHSDEKRSYAYEIVESPMPLRSYRSRFAVEGHGEHAHVDWEADFEPEEAGQESELVESFTQIYREGLESLRRQFESRP